MTKEERYRVILQDLLAEYTPTEVDKEALVITQQADELDTIQSAQNRAMAVDRLSANARRRQEIRMALRRLDEGDYGLCIDCEEPIAPRRLDAVPWTARCVICQEAQEREGMDDAALADDEGEPGGEAPVAGWRKAA